MSSLAERLALVAAYSGKNQQEIARIAGITPSGASKLFNGNSKKIKSQTAFAIARGVPGVDAEWLATGRGSPPGRGTVREPRREYASEFADADLAFLRRFLTLPADLQKHVRAVIEALPARH